MPTSCWIGTTANATTIITRGKIAGDRFVWADPETARFGEGIRCIAAAPGGGIDLITQYRNIGGFGLELRDFLEQERIFRSSDPVQEAPRFILFPHSGIELAVHDDPTSDVTVIGQFGAAQVGAGGSESKEVYSLGAAGAGGARRVIGRGPGTDDRQSSKKYDT